MIEACTVWVPIDRTLVILSSIFMIIGAVHYDRMLFGPYLLWCILDTIVNAALCLLLAKVIGYYVYFAWVIVCFEIYSGFVVLSEFRAIPFKLKTLQEYLDNLKGYEMSHSKKVPKTFSLVSQEAEDGKPVKKPKTIRHKNK